MRIHDASSSTHVTRTAKDLAGAGKGTSASSETSSASSAAGATTVTLSSTAQALSAGSARVDALRAQIQNGTYAIGAQAIAEKLVGSVIAELREILAALAEERDAIKKLDGAGVERAAHAKETFARALASIDVKENHEDLRLVAMELRRNGVLLAHARSCLREVTNLAKSQSRLQGRL